MTKRHGNSAIGLGDLTAAIRELGVNDPSVRNLIAGMLGFQFEAVAGEVKSGGAGAGGGRLVFDEGSRKKDEETGGEGGGGEEETPPTGPEREAIPIEITRAAGEEEGWIEEVEPLPPPPPEGSFEPPALEPLLMPQWTRGILSAALSTNASDGPLDVERVIDMLARCEGVDEFPTLPSPTMRRGLHLLVDKSQALMPFARDQAWLQEEIRNMAGADRVSVFRFAGCPTRGAGDGRKPWPAYEPPPPGTPVVLLTDLGICQPMLTSDWADEAEWAAFAERVRRAGCPQLALVPYGPARWPKSLARVMTLIQWDRGTTAATVTALMKQPREVSLP